MNCPLCKKPIADEAKFCAGCGKKIPRCPTCGTVIQGPKKFCEKDGTRIPEEIVAMFAVAAAPRVPQQPAPQAPRPVAPQQPAPQQPAPQAPRPVAPQQPAPQAPRPVAPQQPAPQAPRPVAPQQPAPQAPRPVAPQQPAPQRPVPPVPQPPRPVNPQPPKKKSTGKGLTVFLIVLLILAILVGGLFICHEMEVIDINFIDEALGTDFLTDFDYDDDDDEDDEEDEDKEAGKKPDAQDPEVETAAPTEPTPVVTYEYTYEIVKGNYTWAGAKAEAERRGGYLATINSPEEYEQICRLADNSGLIYLWMGASLPAGTTEWRWSDGELIPLENYYWYRSGSIVEPSYMDKSDGVREDCLCLWKMTTGSYRWTLNDQRNDLSGLVPADKVGFVIEYKNEVRR